MESSVVPWKISGTSFEYASSIVYSVLVCKIWVIGFRALATYLV